MERGRIRKAILDKYLSKRLDPVRDVSKKTQTVLQEKTPERERETNEMEKKRK